MKRLFIATPVISLSAEVQKISADLRFRLRHDDIVWVKDEVRHLTLRFLGATPPQQIPDIRKALAEACAQSQPFTLEINKIGVFGSHYHPEVIWLGFDHFEPFKKLFEELEPKLLDLGFEPNYGNFVPHITLGRIKNLHSKPKFWESIEAVPSTFKQTIDISELILYQSFLHKEGPEYKVLSRHRLGGEKNFSNGTC
ncbi:MAG: RNA 2',3'-cyclic phosphodiesterase [Bacteroidales bacterium]|jgi:2'-5' RNA ligase|nr:RNA 2',3'-cyclic phosphodiesterase [Bacteroidales bacterium]